MWVWRWGTWRPEHKKISARSDGGVGKEPFLANRRGRRLEVKVSDESCESGSFGAHMASMALSSRTEAYVRSKRLRTEGICCDGNPRSTWVIRIVIQEVKCNAIL